MTLQITYKYVCDFCGHEGNVQAYNIMPLPEAPLPVPIPTSHGFHILGRHHLCATCYNDTFAHAVKHGREAKCG